MTDTRSPRYSAVAIGLHWAIAGLLVGVIWLGWNMETEDGREIEWLYQLHKSVGITILLLSIARLAWRIQNPPLPLPEEMKAWEKTASHLVHLGFYAIMIGAPLAGWALATLAKVQVPTVLYGAVSWPPLPFLSGLSAETKQALYNVIEFLHSKSTWLLIGMVALHVGGALKHEFSEEDGVLKRMIPGLFGKTDGPQAPPKGFLIAFGSALATFMLVAGGPVLAQSLSGSGSGIEPLTENTTGVTANWDVDQSASEIRFTGVHDGDDFTGTFDTWRSQIAFYPEDLAASDVRVDVDLSSVDVAKKLYSDSLKGAEWFDSVANPMASVRLNAFEATDAGYTANADVTIKGNKVSVPFDFVLLETDGKTVMTGSASLARTPLDLGQQSDPTGDWVSEDIRVDVTVTAIRK